MPVFDIECSECNYEEEVIMRSSDKDDLVSQLKCPKCESKVRTKVSIPNVFGRKNRYEKRIFVENSRNEEKSALKEHQTHLRAEEKQQERELKSGINHNV